MKVVGLDVETMGLDPKHKSMTAIGFGIPNEPAVVHFIKQPRDEPGALRWLHARIDRFTPCRVVTWRDFDVEFIHTRAEIHGMPNPLTNAGGFLDLHEYAANNTQYNGRDIHLVDAANMFGLNCRKILSKEMPGLYVRWLAGDAGARDNIISHCKKDIEMMLRVYTKLMC